MEANEKEIMWSKIWLDTYIERMCNPPSGGYRVSELRQLVKEAQNHIEILKKGRKK